MKKIACACVIVFAVLMVMAIHADAAGRGLDDGVTVKPDCLIGM